MKKLFPNIAEKSLSFQFIFLLVLIAIGFVLAFSIGAIASLMVGGMDGLSGVQRQDFSDSSTVLVLKLLQLFTQLGLFVFPSFLFAYFYGDSIKEFLQIRIFPKLTILTVSIVAIVLMIPFIGFLVEINEQMQLPSFLAGLEEWMKLKEEEAKVLTEVFLRVNSFSGLLFNLLIIGVLAGLGEELLFRGVLQNMIYKKSHRIHLAIWISAIIFSAIHMQFFGFLPRMILGALFGYVYHWTKNLWIPILMHTVFNSTTVVAAFLAEKEIIETTYDEVGSFDNPVIIWLTFAVGVYGFWWVYQKHLYKP